MTNIKVFADFMCPFCYIGFTIADRVRKEHPEVKFEWKPSVLNYDLNEEGEDITKLVDPSQIDKGYERITMLGSEYGLVYNNRTANFNTNRLHKAGLFARDEDLYYEFAKKAFQTIFEDGENVAKKEVVNNIAKSVNLDVDRMNQAIDSGKYDEEFDSSVKEFDTLGLESVPSFILEDGTVVTRLKAYEDFKNDLLKK